MTFVNPWGLWGLLAVPTILAIHLFHRRFPPLPAAGLHLWGVETQTRLAGRRLDRLPITATLLLELLAAVLLTLLVAQPRLPSLGLVPHLVVVLDDSASMSAVDDQRTAVYERAATDLRRRLDDLPRDTRVTLIRSGRRPVLLAGPATDKTEALAALDRWTPRAARHDFGPAWDLASQLAGEDGELLFLTDAPLNDPGLDFQGSGISAEIITATDRPTPPERMRILTYGEAGDNVGFVAAGWTVDEYADTDAVFVRVRNFGDRSKQITLTGRIDRSADTDSEPNAEPLFTEQLDLAAGESISREIAIESDAEQIEVTLVTDADRLSLDNRVRLLRPEPKPVRIDFRVADDHPAYGPLLDVLDLIPTVEILSDPAETPTEEQPGNTSDSAAPSKPSTDLIIVTNSDEPPTRSRAWWLAVGPFGEEAERIDLAPETAYAIEKGSPLLTGVRLDGVTWGGVATWTATEVEGEDGKPPWEPITPLIAAGEYDLFVRHSGTATTSLLLNIDLSRTDWTQTDSWPIFVGNLIETRRASLPGPGRRTYRLGEPVRFRLPSDDGNEGATAATQELTLIPEGDDAASRPIARTSIVELPSLSEPGLYRVLDGEREVTRLLFNFFDATESDLRGMRTNLGDEADPLKEEFRLDDPYSWVVFVTLAALVAVIFLNWWVLSRD